MSKTVINDKEVKVISTIYNINGVLGASVIIGELTKFQPEIMRQYSIVAVGFIAVSIIGCGVYVIIKNVVYKLKSLMGKAYDRA